MKKKKYRLSKRIKYKRNYKKHFPQKPNEVYYSIGTPCTWKEKLPQMSNPKYMLLYGIAPNIIDLSVEVFKQEYFRKPVELFTNQEYVRKIGAKQQSKINGDTEVLTGNFNYVGVVIQKCNVPETSEIADMIKDAFDNQMIKSHADEIKFINDYCRNMNVSAYTFPPKYVEIVSGLSTMKMMKPKAYIIVNPNIIVDVAIGDDNIISMVNKYIKQNETSTESKIKEIPKQAPSATIEKLKQAKNPLDVLNAFDRK